VVARRLPTVDEAVEAGWTCVVDPTSIVGLRTLERLWPETWHQVMARGFPPVGTAPGSQATLAEVLQSGWLEDLRPRGPDDGGRVRPLRAAAAAAVRYAGEVLCCRLTGEAIEGLRGSIAVEYKAGTTSRIIRVIRKAARTWAELNERSTAALDRRTGNRRVGGRKRRRRIPPEDLVRLLEASDPRLRAAIAGTAGAGLLHSEIRKRRIRDMGRGAAALLVEHAKTRGLPGVAMERVVPVAAWARPMLASAVQWIRCPYPDAAVFPGHDPDPRVAQKSLHKQLRSACKRAFGKHGRRYTWMDLRLFWQDAAVSAGLPRAVVRGTNSARSPALGRRRARRLEELVGRFAAAWTNLHAPPCGWTRRAWRQAPSGTAPDQPEGVPIRARRRSMEPLPTSCRAPTRDPERRDGFGPASDGGETSIPPRGPVARERFSEEIDHPAAVSPHRSRGRRLAPLEPLSTRSGRSSGRPTRPAPGGRPNRPPAPVVHDDEPARTESGDSAIGVALAGAVVLEVVRHLADQSDEVEDEEWAAPPDCSVPFTMELLRASRGWMTG
jgi:hypothetical protein